MSMSTNVQQVRMIVDARQQVEAILDRHGIEFGGFTQQAIGWKLEWCFYAGMDASTATRRIAAEYLSQRRAA